MVLYVIGLGLGDEKDITVRGLETIRKSKTVFLEHYTSILGVDVQQLSLFYGVEIVIADRDKCEIGTEDIYKDALHHDISFLVVGDPLCATTHTDLILRAKALGISVVVIHNASVMSASASSGLQLYQFGYTVSIPFFEDSWKPDSFYDRIAYNSGGGMHTLCLLDIKVKEPDYAAMSAGKLRYLPPRFMTVNTAIDQLLEIEAIKGRGIATSDTMAVGMARLGQATQKIIYGTLAQLRLVDFGPPLHSLALCGDVHPMETDILRYYVVKEEDLRGGAAVEKDAAAEDREEADGDESDCS